VGVGFAFARAYSQFFSIKTIDYFIPMRESKKH
jgi:hypothetical protein